MNELPPTNIFHETFIPTYMVAAAASNLESIQFVEECLAMNRVLADLNFRLRAAIAASTPSPPPSSVPRPEEAATLLLLNLLRLGADIYKERVSLFRRFDHRHHLGVHPFPRHHGHHRRGLATMNISRAFFIQLFIDTDTSVIATRNRHHQRVDECFRALILRRMEDVSSRA
jgi:hypothetical protein